MNEHVEDKLVGWSTIIVALAWIVAALIFILFSIVALGEHNLFIFLMGVAISADVLIANYFVSRLTLAFAEITQNTRELNLNIQKAFLNNIQATEKNIAEETRLERDRAEQRRREAERIEAEKKREIARRREEAARRKEAYWQAHAAEKEALIAKRAEAEKALITKGITDKERQELRSLILRIDEELERER